MTTVAIIGGGLGGLAAGCLLQSRGARCTIYEQRASLGGLASLQLSPQVAIEAGVSWLAGCGSTSPTRGLYAQLGLTEGELLRPEPLLARFYDPSLGRHVDVTRDLDRLGTDLVALAPAHETEVAEMLEGARAFAAAGGVAHALSGAPELEGFVGRIATSLRARPLRRWKESPRWSLPPEEAWKAQETAGFLRDFTRALAGAGAPVWCAMAALGDHAAGGTARVQGGASALVAALSGRFAALGGRVSTGAQVRQVELEGDRAKGLSLAQGTRVFADAVICTTDPWQTHATLLEGHDIDEAAATRIAYGAVAWPTAFVHLVIEGEVLDAPWRAGVLLREPRTVGDHAVRELALRYLGPGEGGTPAGHTTLQVALETSWDWWCDDDAKSEVILDVRRTALVTTCTALLTALHPSIAGRIRRTEAITPDLVHRATGAHQGLSGAWLATPEAWRQPLPVRLPGLRNVYGAGQWHATHPGALGAMHAGRCAAQLLCRDRGLPFEGL